MMSVTSVGKDVAIEVEELREANSKFCGEFSKTRNDMGRLFRGSRLC